jgi:hypothetical protein
MSEFSFLLELASDEVPLSITGIFDSTGRSIFLSAPIGPRVFRLLENDPHADDRLFFYDILSQAGLKYRKGSVNA